MSSAHSGRLNVLAGFERYLEMAVVLDVPATDPGGGEETASPSPEGDGYPLVEAQLRDTQVMLQRMTATVADMARMIHPGRARQKIPRPRAGIRKVPRNGTAGKA